ncbi:MAG: hypothetical protein D6711_10285 [Chloroflexi bacterium]|nr:MAG: hypothetical protein D6711_10285 [Chloroflexota bacterium]
MMLILQVVLIENHINSRPNTLVFPDEEVQEIGRGVDIGISLEKREVIIQTSLAIGFLIIAILSWVGKPAFMRHILRISVVLISAVSIYMLLQPKDAWSGGSLDSLLDQLTAGFIAWYILVPLYVVWYLNRGPARAFYRGYYLTEEVPDTPAPDQT